MATESTDIENKSNCDTWTVEDKNIWIKTLYKQVNKVAEWFSKKAR